MELPKPAPEHKWLKQLVGAWTYQSACPEGPDGKPFNGKGRETVRTLGDLWIVGESTGDMPGGGTMTALLTLGFDPVRGAFVGSWVGSPMSNMFVYEGRLDDARRVLTLDTTGPDFADPTETARYRDVIEIISEDERVMRSEMLADGQWQEINRATYRRAD
jgi:hypothetical protein